MKNIIMGFIGLLFLSSPLSLKGQVGIGTTLPDPTSVLEVNSTTRGMLIPRMTSAQKLAIASPATGLLIFQTNGTQGFYYYNGSTWLTFGTIGWGLTGDAGTNVSTNFLGTLDAQDFVFSTNGSELMRVDANGLMGIGTNNPTEDLHISGAAPVIRIQDGNEAANRVLTSDANGVAYWGDSSVLATGDQDWVFSSGSTINDPVYRDGATVIGRTGTTTHNLDVDNGANTGTTFGIGDVEYILDGNSETQFSHSLVPDFDNSNSLGTLSNRWNTIYAVNGTIQTSDGTKKTNVTNLAYGISDLMKLEPVSYYWKNSDINNYSIPEDEKQLKLGLIAQDVKKVVPEVVYDYSWKPKNEEEKEVYVKRIYNRMGINYEELVPLLVKSKQEQHKKLVELQALNKQLLEKLTIVLNSKKQHND